MGVDLISSLSYAPPDEKHLCFMAERDAALIPGNPETSDRGTSHPWYRVLNLRKKTQRPKCETPHLPGHPRQPSSSSRSPSATDTSTASVSSSDSTINDTTTSESISNGSSSSNSNSISSSTKAISVVNKEEINSAASLTSTRSSHEEDTRHADDLEQQANLRAQVDRDSLSASDYMPELKPLGAPHNPRNVLTDEEEKQDRVEPTKSSLSLSERSSRACNHTIRAFPLRPEEETAAAGAANHVPTPVREEAEGSVLGEAVDDCGSFKSVYGEHSAALTTQGAPTAGEVNLQSRSQLIADENSLVRGMPRQALQAQAWIDDQGGITSERGGSGRGRANGTGSGTGSSRGGVRGTSLKAGMRLLCLDIFGVKTSGGEISRWREAEVGEVVRGDSNEIMVKILFSGNANKQDSIRLRLKREWKRLAPLSSLSQEVISGGLPLEGDALAASRKQFKPRSRREGSHSAGSGSARGSVATRLRSGTAAVPAVLSPNSRAELFSSVPGDAARGKGIARKHRTQDRAWSGGQSRNGSNRRDAAEQQNTERLEVSKAGMTGSSEGRGVGTFGTRGIVCEELVLEPLSVAPLQLEGSGLMPVVSAAAPPPSPEAAASEGSVVGGGAVLAGRANEESNKARKRTARDVCDMPKPGDLFDCQESFASSQSSEDMRWTEAEVVDVRHTNIQVRFLNQLGKSDCWISWTEERERFAPFKSRASLGTGRGHGNYYRRDSTASTATMTNSSADTSGTFTDRSSAPYSHECTLDVLEEGPSTAHSVSNRGHGERIGHLPARRGSSSGSCAQAGSRCSPTGSSQDSEASADAVFRENMRRKGLSIVDVEPDGNCLFRSVSHQIFGDAERHHQVRKACVDHMAKHRARFGVFVAEDFRDYLYRISHPGVWGDDLEIRALEELFDRPIEIYSSEGEDLRPMKIDFDASGLDMGTAPIKLSYHGQSHYNSVRDHSSQYPLYPRKSKNILHMRQAQHANTPRSAAASLSRAGGGMAGGGLASDANRDILKDFRWSDGGDAAGSRRGAKRAGSGGYSGGSGFGGSHSDKGSSGHSSSSSRKSLSASIRTLLGGVARRMPSAS